MAGDGEIEQSRGDGVIAQGKHAPNIGRFEPGLNQSGEHSGEFFGCGIEGRFTGCIEDGSAKGERDSNRQVP